MNVKALHVAALKARAREIFDDGVNAYCNGVSIRKNPYQPGTQEWESWEGGYHDAAAYDYDPT